MRSWPGPHCPTTSTAVAHAHHRRTLPPEHHLTVLLADDHPALRAGLKSLLSSEPGIEVIAEAGNGEDALLAYREQRADVVILDLSMPGFGGMEALRRIRQHDSEARILVYSVHTSDVMLHRALALGALAYVTKGSDSDTLIRGVREVGESRGFVSPDLIPAMVRNHMAEGRSLFTKLGGRQFSVFLLTAEGKTPAECAGALNLSEKTVRNHLTQIKDSLAVEDTAALIRLAIRAGLVNP